MSFKHPAITNYTYLYDALSDLLGLLAYLLSFSTDSEWRVRLLPELFFSFLILFTFARVLGFILV